MISSSANYETILNLIRQWPVNERKALIRDLQASLQEINGRATTAKKEPTLQRALGLLTNDQANAVDEQEWLRAAARNPAFADLHDPIEDIYTLADGKPLHDKV